MMLFRRVLALLGSLLGVLGVVVCVAGIAAVWSLGSRLSQTNEHVFERVDKSLASVRERVLGVQQRVQESKLTTDAIAQSLKNRTRKEAAERLASRLDVEQKAAGLARGLEQADLWLEMSGGSLQSVQQALVLGHSLGAPVDAEMVDPLLKRLALMQGQLKQANETVERIRDLAADITEGRSQEERLDRAVQLTRMVVATVTEIDSRLGESAEGLAEIQVRAQHLKSKTHRWVAMATLIAVLFVVWMGVGQACLCLYGWKGYRRTRSTG